MALLSLAHKRAEIDLNITGKLDAHELPRIARLQRVGCILSPFFGMEEAARSEIADEAYVISALVEACDLAAETAVKLVQSTQCISECFRLTWESMSSEDQAMAMGIDYSRESNFWPHLDVYSRALQIHLTHSSQTQGSLMSELRDSSESVGPHYDSEFLDEVDFWFNESKYTSRFQRIGAILDLFDMHASDAPSQWAYEAHAALDMLVSYRIERPLAAWLIASQDWPIRFRITWALMDDHERAEAITEEFDVLHNYWPGFGLYNKTLSKHINLNSSDPYTLLRCPPSVPNY